MSSVQAKVVKFVKQEKVKSEGEKKKNWFTGDWDNEVSTEEF